MLRKSNVQPGKFLENAFFSSFFTTKKKAQTITPRIFIVAGHVRSRAGRSSSTGGHPPIIATPAARTSWSRSRGQDVVVGDSRPRFRTLLLSILFHEVFNPRHLLLTSMFFERVGLALSSPLRCLGVGREWRGGSHYVSCCACGYGSYFLRARSSTGWEHAQQSP